MKTSLRNGILVVATLSFLTALPRLAGQQTRQATQRQPIFTSGELATNADSTARRELLGTHRLTLQWISWKKFGGAVVSAQGDGTFILHGKQTGEGGDFVTIDGTITDVDDSSFTFQGSIVAKVHYNNGGAPCPRQGVFHFTKGRHPSYWRMKEIQNPCEDVVDYVDLYLRK